MNIILISGEAGSGKDTLAKYMQTILHSADYRVKITHFADVLKYVCKEYFNWDGKKDQYGRWLLQYVGTDLFRSHYSAFWAVFLAKVCTVMDYHNMYDIMIIPDLRYENELEWMQFYDFSKVNTVCILGKDKAGDRCLTSEEENHSSENEWKDIKFNKYINPDADPIKAAVNTLASFGYACGDYTKYIITEEEREKMFKTRKQVMEDREKRLDKMSEEYANADASWRYENIPVGKPDTIKFAKLNPRAKIPTKRDEDGCYDIYACFSDDEMLIEPHETKLIPTGICSAFDKKYRISLRERGSNSKSGLKVSCGQIDSGYNGEWFVALYNTHGYPVSISKRVNEINMGLRDCGYSRNVLLVPYDKAIAQAAVEYVPVVEIEEVSPEEIKNRKTLRGEGKLGSSGK